MHTEVLFSLAFKSLASSLKDNTSILSLDHQLVPCMSAMHERHTSFVTDNTDSTLSNHNKAI